MTHFASVRVKTFENPPAPQQINAEHSSPLRHTGQLWTILTPLFERGFTTADGLSPKVQKLFLSQRMGVSIVDRSKDIDDTDVGRLLELNGPVWQFIASNDYPIDKGGLGELHHGNLPAERRRYIVSGFEGPHSIFF